MDCELLSKVYINLIDQREPTFNLTIDKSSYDENVNSKSLYFHKIVKPTDDELKLHKDFLKKEIKKNYFS